MRPLQADLGRHAALPAGLYPYYVEACVDVKDFPGHAAGEVRQEIERGPRDVLLGNVPSQGRLGLDDVEYVLEARDSGSREGLYGPCRDGFDPYAPGAEVRGEVARARLERGLGHAHDVVVRYHLFAPVVAHGDYRALPALHEGGGGPLGGHGGEGAFGP